MITLFTSDPRINTAVSMGFTSSNSLPIFTSSFTSSNRLDFYSLLEFKYTEDFTVCKFKYTEVFTAELPLDKLSRKILFLRGVSSVKSNLF